MEFDYAEHERECEIIQNKKHLAVFEKELTSSRLSKKQSHHI